MSTVQEKAEKKATCYGCKQKFSEEEIKFHKDKVFCKTCFEEQIRSCATCGKEFLEEDLHFVHDLLYCSDCLDEDFRLCTACEEYETADDARYSEIRNAYYCAHCAGEYLYYCVRCDTEIDGDNAPGNDEGLFCDECWPEEENGDRDFVQHHEFSGSSFIRSKSKRKYGVEIEACLDEDSEHLSASEVGSWSKQHDGSLGDSGREYASPILQGDEGFTEIERLCGVLREWGYFVRKSCGLHVHIDGRDLTVEDIKKLLKIALLYEPVIYAMLPNSRFQGSYSVPLGRFPKSRMKIRVTDEETLKALWYGRDQKRVDLKSKYHHSRYFGVNIHSWFFRRSVEFRYHSGTLNPLKITNFIRLCQAMVDKAKEVGKFRARKFTDFKEQFENFISFLEIPEDLSAYIRERITKFHPEHFPIQVLSPEVHA